MLSIRMQRRGRKGHAVYRVVVQDSRWAPTSGKVVAYLGHYDPHTKINTLVKDKAQFYLDPGARPSQRVQKLLKEEGIKLPKWLKEPSKQERTVKNPEKLRKNRPSEEPVVEEPKPEVKSDDVTPEAEEPSDETVVEESKPKDDQAAEENSVEK